MPSARRNTPTTPLRKLKTAFTFSPATSPSRRSDSDSSLSPTASTSPLSASTSSTSASSVSPTKSCRSHKPHNFYSSFRGFTHSNASTPTLTLPSSGVEDKMPDLGFGSVGMNSGSRVIRRKKSCVEIEQEREMQEVDSALVGLVEPRPRHGPARGGIEEVLFGKV